MGILRLLGVERDQEPHARHRESVERMALEAQAAMDQARAIRRETSELLRQALLEAAALTSTITAVIAREAGIDVGALEHGPRHALRNKLHGILMAMGILADERPDDAAVDEARAAVGLLVGEALRTLDAERDREPAPDADAA